MGRKKERNRTQAGHEEPSREIRVQDWDIEDASWSDHDPRITVIDLRRGLVRLKNFSAPNVVSIVAVVAVAVMGTLRVDYWMPYSVLFALAVLAEVKHGKIALEDGKNSALIGATDPSATET